MSLAVNPYFIDIEEGGSSNTMLAAMADELPHGAVLCLHSQSAGRGQRGNSWESEPGSNLTLSILLRPEAIEARSQFVISEIVSMAIVETLRSYLPDSGKVAVKWPNDIYAGDRKICGILIENVIAGSLITRSIAGIGLNVNQEKFLSDAPNPVSLVQLTGRKFNLTELRKRLCDNIMNAFAYFSDPGTYSELHARYTAMLWRREGMHPYIDAATGEEFKASITGVAPTGHITLTDGHGNARTYAFKEVAAVI